MSDERTLESLRAALQVSPENIPLRMHYGELLMRLRRYDEAETQYRDALGFDADNNELKLALAHCFYEQTKNSEALVIVESLVKASNPPAQALVLYARLLLRAGDERGAVHQYRAALDADQDQFDEALSDELGVWPVADWSGDAHADADAWKQREPAGDMPGPADGHVELERPKISFDDVGGMDAVKDEIRMKIIHPLTHPEIYAAYGKNIGGGILMYGPPGCGKTHLARATAGEVQAAFISVGIHDVLDMWIGNSEKQLHELFEQARRNTPCVLFFDEVDALGASRSDMKTSGGRHLINQFLSELDGVDVSNDGVLILAATNAPWHLDSAFRRPGRFDRVLFVPPPDRQARAAITRILLTGKPTDRVDCEYLAKKTEGFSGADLKAVIDVAVEAKLRQAMTAGTPQPIINKDLTEAIRHVKPSTKEWFSTAKNYALFSNQGGAYDDILDYLNLRK